MKTLALVQKCLGLFLAATLSLLISANLALAGGRVTKASGKAALLEFDADTVPTEGSSFYVMSGGKKIGIIEITQIKGNRAKGSILKGRAEAGAELEAKGGGEFSTESGSSSSRGRGSNARVFQGATWGLLGGININSQSIAVPISGGTDVVPLAGTGFSFRGFYDHTISGGFGVLSRAGIEQLVAKGTYAALDGSTSILYIAGDLYGRYIFGQGKFAPFILGGVGFYFPMSKTAPLLEGNIGLTTVFAGGGGINYQLSSGMFINFTGEYMFYPPSNTVKTTSIALRGGVGWRW
jgi:hypothetical protein